MPSTKSIPGIQKGPDFDREAHEPSHVEAVEKEIKLDRKPELNDPVVAAAMEALKEVEDSFGREMDLQYERNSGLLVMTIYDDSGEKIIRRIPPDDAIRLAQNRKKMRAQYLDAVF